MATGSTSCFPNDSETPGQGSHMYGNQEFNRDVLSMNETSAEFDSQSASLLYNLALLKDKVQQVQSLVGDGDGMFLNHSQTTAQSTAVAMGSMSTLLQEIIIAASSMMFTCQQISLGASQSKARASNDLTVDKLNDGLILSQQNYGDSTTLDWYGENYSSTTCYKSKNISEGSLSLLMVDESERLSTSKDCDIIEMDAADLLAKYTHYCQICGKGFKRDANLRMHMRAHGEEYKSSAALSNPMKKVEGSNGNGDDVPKIARKYSCPQEGCRWNRKHAKFQPLKSMICAKNHYKRSHCPKMYVCKRCNRKQFSVLSDLRTHEKHCGDLKWQCSCGTTFSRKDKLLGHVALFHGHTPAINSSYNRSTINIVLDDSRL